MIKIKIFGVGGAGCNAVNYMIDKEIEGVEFVAANTDTQALLNSNCSTKISLGFDLFKGLGAGGDPSVGEKAARASEKEIRDILKGTDLLFLICGMGGGTGTGATPVIAEFAKSMNILTIAAVTKPFNFEGKLRTANSEKGVLKLKENVDSLLIISNNKLLAHQGSSPILDSFVYSDETLRLAVQTITDLIVQPSRINLDFADVKKVFKNKKNSFFGFGIGEGKQKGVQAAKKALSSKILEASPKGLKNAIINFTGGSDTSMFDVTDAIDYLKTQTGKNVDILFGLKVNKEMGNKMMVSIIGTDFDEQHIESEEDLVEKIRRNRSISEEEKNKPDSDDFLNNDYDFLKEEVSEDKTSYKKDKKDEEE